MSNQQNYNDWERVLGLFLAIGIVIVFVYFIFRPPTLNSLTIQIIRYLAALVSALLAYLFSGSLDVRFSSNIKVRAAGAFATFITVFFLFSYGISSDLTPPSPNNDLTNTNPNQSSSSPPPELTTVPEPLPESGDASYDYSTLEELLKIDKWKDADEATTRAILEAADMKNESYLKLPYIEKLPCENLRLINQLWLESSGKKFGFSVQRDIYKRLGGTKEYNESIWYEFQETVDWGKEGNDFTHKDFTFDLQNAKKGHLPSLRGKIKGKDDNIIPSRLWGEFFFYITNTCSM